MVVGGTSFVDESMITGEPMPVDKNDGDPVALNYLMRGPTGDMKVVDVFLDGLGREGTVRVSHPIVDRESQFDQLDDQSPLGVQRFLECREKHRAPTLPTARTGRRSSRQRRPQRGL